jgi:hypothetical protein
MGIFVLMIGELLLGILSLVVALPCLIGRERVTAEIIARRPRRDPTVIRQYVRWLGPIALLSACCWLAIVAMA